MGISISSYVIKHILIDDSRRSISSKEQIFESTPFLARYRVLLNELKTLFVSPSHCNQTPVISPKYEWKVSLLSSHVA